MTHQPANTLRDKITIENIWAIGPNNFLETTIVEWLLNKKSISQQCDFFWLVIAQSLIEKKRHARISWRKATLQSIFFSNFKHSLVIE